MEQKLSAMNYIKNNKRRISVLVVSLMMCFTMFYLAQFLLSATSETFGSLLVDNSKKVQYVSLPLGAFDIEREGKTDEELLQEKLAGHQKLAKQLKELSGVKDTYVVQVNYIEVLAVIGQYYMEVPMLNLKDIENYMEHFHARLIDGRMPRMENELLIDEKLMKNASYQLGDAMEGYPDTKIVGVVECENYFACGAGVPDMFGNPMVCVLSDGSVRDMTAAVRNLGYEFDADNATIVDSCTGAAALKRDITDVIGPSSNLIFVGIISVLSISLCIVYISYLRDRRNEWCLYCSIGFSRRTIYASVMRELLFVFVTAVAGAGCLITVSEVILNATVIKSLGLMCRYFYPDVVVEILCAYALIFGILQLPLRYALYQIRTIDAMDDELN